MHYFCNVLLPNTAWDSSFIVSSIVRLMQMFVEWLKTSMSVLWMAISSEPLRDIATIIMVICNPSLDSDPEAERP